MPREKKYALISAFEKKVPGLDKVTHRRMASRPSPRLVRCQPGRPTYEDAEQDDTGADFSTVEEPH
jgi:hypothetical protein